MSDSKETKREKSAAVFDIQDFTCDNCSSSDECKYAFDPYNTDGDCLAEK